MPARRKLGLEASSVACAKVNAGREEGGPGVNEPNTVDRLEARDLIVRGFGVIALLIVSFIAVAAM